MKGKRDNYLSYLASRTRIQYLFFLVIVTSPFRYLGSSSLKRLIYVIG